MLFVSNAAVLRWFYILLKRGDHGAIKYSSY